MKSYSSREVLKLLQADGWFEINCEGDHHQFKHLKKAGKSDTSSSGQRLECSRFKEH